MLGMGRDCARVCLRLWFRARRPLNVAMGLRSEDRSEDFHTEWMHRLDDFLPAPCVVLSLLAILSSEAPWRSALVAALYLVSNLGISHLARTGSQVDYFGLARMSTSTAVFFFLGWIGGAESLSWPLAMIGLFGTVFCSKGTTRPVSMASFILSAALGAWLGGRGLLSCLAAAVVLASMAWLASGLVRSLYTTWLEARSSAQALEEHNQALESALATRQAFLATMSHEVRTPLNGVLGMAELLARTPLEAGQQEMLDSIQDSGEGLLQVLNDILDTAKLDAGKIALETLPFDPLHLVESVCRLMRTKTHGRPVQLRAHSEGSLPPQVAGDPARLRQVLLNLVGNALKFTEAGEVRVSLQWRPDTLKVSVQDTGIGVSPEAQARIFEPFGQAELGTTREYGGTGLGLTISRRLVDLMGGELSLTSTLGQGSCFCIALPAPRATAEVPPEPNTSPPEGPLPEHVLIVEDNPVNLLVTSRMLEALGCTILTAANGQEALDLVAVHAVDLILMDCRMPVMDGFEATRRLRAQAHFLPILALTAGVTEEERAACHAAGMDAVLPKPLKLEQLRETMLAHCSPEKLSA